MGTPVSTGRIKQAHLSFTHMLLQQGHFFAAPTLFAHMDSTLLAHRDAKKNGNYYLNELQTSEETWVSLSGNT
jgi:hypothetical protein